MQDESPMQAAKHFSIVSVIFPVSGIQARTRCDQGPPNRPNTKNFENFRTGRTVRTPTIRTLVDPDGYNEASDTAQRPSGSVGVR